MDCARTACFVIGWLAYDDTYCACGLTAAVCRMLRSSKSELSQKRQSHRFLGAFAKLRKATISFVMTVRLSVRPHGTTQLPLDGFS